MNPFGIVHGIAQATVADRGRCLFLFVVAVVGLNGWLTGPRPAARVTIAADDTSTTLLGDGRTLLTEISQLRQTWEPCPGPKHLWDVQTGAHRRSLGSPDVTYSHVTMSPDARWAVRVTRTIGYRFGTRARANRSRSSPRGLGRPTNRRLWVRVRPDTFMTSGGLPDSLVRFSPTPGCWP
jgi:hypothetical protein